MKKIILSAAAAVAITLAGCGNKTENKSDAGQSDQQAPVEVVETDEIVVVSEAEAPALLDSIKAGATTANVQKGLDYVNSLIKSGKLTEAQNYLEQLKPYADKAGLTDAVNNLSNTISKAEATGAAVTEATQKGQNLIDKAKAGTEKAADAVKDKTVDIYDKAKAGTEKAAGAVKDKTVDIYDKAKSETEKAAGAVKDETKKVIKDF